LQSSLQLDYKQWHPHAHVFSTDGAFSEGGVFHPLADWDGEELMRLFRERLLAHLVEKRAISQDLVATLMSWRHPGFSVHVGDPIPTDDSKTIEDMAGYVIRNPLSLKCLVYLDGPKVLAPQVQGQQAVIYRALKPNPALGRNPSARFAAQDASASSPWTRWNGWLVRNTQRIRVFLELSLAHHWCVRGAYDGSHPRPRPAQDSFLWSRLRRDHRLATTPTVCEALVLARSRAKRMLKSGRSRRDAVPRVGRG
jgi:hypothetical protein